MREHELLRSGERIDDLQVNGLRLIQDPAYFCFGIDSVLLANFSKILPGQTVVDLGTGNGIIPVLLAGKTPCSHATGLEIQPETADMARRSVLLNNLEDKITIIEGDLRDPSIISPRTADVVTCNPPYKELGGGLLNENKPLAIARHEIECTLEAVVLAAKRILKPCGRLFLVHRPERLVDIISTLRRHALEPKTLQLVHPVAQKAANIVLVEALLDGNPQLRCLPPIILYDD